MGQITGIKKEIYLEKNTEKKQIEKTGRKIKEKSVR
jgi:hypothetical protein